MLLPKRKRTVAVSALAALVVAGGVAAGVTTLHRAAAATITGTELDRPVPNVPLLDSHGRRLTLAAYRGKVVVLSPTLTLCHEVCPLTTGAFLSMERAVRRAGLADRVVFAEISVDPWRDSPARLRAFARLARVDFPLLTGSARDLRRFWRFFGVGYFKTPAGKPPDVDWWTHKAETFDVAHSDGLFFVDARGHLRIVVLGMPNVHGRLAARLRRLLSAEGVRNLDRPQAPWTVPQALNDLGALLRTRIPPAP